MIKKKILFVCLGNICRSPSAEAVMKAKLEKHQLNDKYLIDSAGITGFHEGSPADHRMQQHAFQRGYLLTSLSRPIQIPTDFYKYDHIIAMDKENMSDLTALAPDNFNSEKLSKMTDYCTHFTHDSVPDPYYGGAAGFELVLDLLEDACEGLIKKLESEWICFR
ncbi:low molecular weight protein-tyrosine-phosphatase [Saccharicrinis fermentans]|uniref:Low molecular weight protein-tyrosine-phosphatase YfkJ n=2 Tax=Saccharicrinis fermentans TaxID=982 RepID=W7Y6B3_9BACT|nr:low molecular weight protein-tyrosine-phosphatase [Saccharicrinis fermentans]GAF03722.1 low molecular weight protein-tyrosine-phosphatase YfkJ [Saccharicrinis fermentans DSM 9555 = JCM 21142]